MSRFIACVSESDTVKLPRRTFLHLAAAAAALPVVSGIVLAQTYPTRPVRSHVDVSGTSQVPRRSILCLCPALRPRPNNDPSPL